MGASEPDGRRPTMKDVATLANVSLSTVSRFVNGEPGRPELVARIQQAIDLLGYQRDLTASTLRRADRASASIGVVVADVPPKVRVRTESDAASYARKANRVTVRHPDGQVVAVIEIVSPGNKDSKHAVRSFARKAVEFLHAGVNLLIVDLFPPSKRDPQGVHKLIWDRIRDEPFELPAGQPLTLTDPAMIRIYPDRIVSWGLEEV